MKKLKKVELTFKEGGLAVFAVSLVSDPAIQENFMKFSKEEEVKIFKMSEDEQRIVTGAVLIPNKMIYRNAQSMGEECMVYFSEDTVKKAAYNYLMSSNNNNVTLEHSEKSDDVRMLESWVISDEDNDKAYSLGFTKEQAPKGTWFASYYINDDDTWENVKNGTFNGFSVEVEAMMASAQLSIQTPSREDCLNKIKELTNKRK